MTDHPEDDGPRRIEHGHSLTRRFYGFFGIKSARAKRADSDE